MLTCLNKETDQTERIHSSSSWESRSISQTLHGIFSATTNSKLVLFILLA